jgi:hypothetical protein
MPANPAGQPCPRAACAVLSGTARNPGDLRTSTLAVSVFAGPEFSAGVDKGQLAAHTPRQLTRPGLVEPWTSDPAGGDLENHIKKNP